MAHHNKTPKSVLEAPEAVEVPIITHGDLNREQRRHPSQGKRAHALNKKTTFKPMLPGSNEVYIKGGE